MLEPHTGGNKIPIEDYDLIRSQLEKFALSRPWSEKFRLIPRFKGQFCYVDVIKNGEEKPDPLLRLRHFSMTSWSFDFFSWGNEKYQPCAFPSGQAMGLPEDAIVACEAHIF